MAAKPFLCRGVRFSPKLSYLRNVSLAVCCVTLFQKCSFHTLCLHYAVIPKHEKQIFTDKLLFIARPVGKRIQVSYVHTTFSWKEIWVLSYLSYVKYVDLCATIPRWLVNFCQIGKDCYWTGDRLYKNDKKYHIWM